MTIPIGAITDEFSLDLDTALDAMSRLGMTIAELRLIGDRNIIDLSDDEIRGVRDQVEKRGLRVLSIASPVLKCVLPDAPPLDERFQQDVFGSAYTIADQPRLSARSGTAGSRARPTTRRPSRRRQARIVYPPAPALPTLPNP